jgi:hypothetical protein
MNATKDVIWLTGLLCLSPTAGMAADEPPILDTANSLETAPVNPVAPATAQIAEPTSKTVANRTVDQLGQQAITPKLYGESEQSVATPTFTDSFDQLSDRQWMNLLSDPTPVTQPTVQSSSTAAPSEALELPVSQSAANLIASAPVALSDFSSLPIQNSPQYHPSQSPSQLLSQPQPSSSFSPIASPHESAHFSQFSFAEAPALSATIAQSSLSPSSSPPSPDSTLESPHHIDDSMSQVTSVSQLADVQPTDWAYQALQSLVERYGIIQGYPDGLFRGNRALTRYEFAAGVNAAMDRITQLVANGTTNAVSKADLDTLKRLQNDFDAELIRLRGRLDGLDARLSELSAHRFSTTVRLNGQVTFGLADAWGGKPPGEGRANPVFAYLAQLQLSGSFSQRDAFRIDLDAGNFAGGGFAQPQALNTQTALLGFQTDTNNTVEITGAEYRVAVADRLVLTFKPVGFDLSAVLSPNSIYTNVSQGALSRFAAESPIFRLGNLDAGAGLDWLVTDRLRLQVAYGARNAGDPGGGLFSSAHRALGVQLLAKPFSNLTTGIAYVNAFSADGFLDTFTGSKKADTSGGILERSTIHAVSGTFQWQVIPQLILGAWGGVTITDSLSSNAVAVSTTYLFSLGFPDTFGRQGDLLGILVGQPLRLRYGLQIEREDSGSGLHFEVFYRLRVNDHLAVIPGIFVVTEPGHVAGNNTIVVGAIRTSFSF